MKLWRGKNAYVCYVCNIHTQIDLYEVDWGLLRESFHYLCDAGPWKIYSCVAPCKSKLAFYRKKILIFYDIPLDGYTDTDDIIRNFLENREGALRIVDKLKTLLGENIIDIFFYPAIFIKDFKVEEITGVSTKLILRNEPTWIDDGVTTFFYRIFDSTLRRIGYIRISRHLVICYGLSDPIIREVINLVYEKFLYRMPDVRQIAAEQVFDLLDGLNRYTVPTELNVFLQDMGIRLAVYLTFAAVVISIAQDLADEISNVYLGLCIYLTVLLVLAVAWRIVAKIRLFGKE